MYMYIYIYIYTYCPVSWGFKIHQLLLCRGRRPPLPKQSDGFSFGE